MDVLDKQIRLILRDDQCVGHVLPHFLLEFHCHVVQHLEVTLDFLRERGVVR